LRYYATRFSTLEVNYTFNHLPTEKNIATWKDATPPDFLFALKASQQITHVRQLRDPAETVPLFFERAAPLGERFGPVLFQPPPWTRGRRGSVHIWRTAGTSTRTSATTTPAPTRSRPSGSATRSGEALARAPRRGRVHRRARTGDKRRGGARRRDPLRGRGVLRRLRRHRRARARPRALQSRATNSRGERHRAVGARIPLGTVRGRRVPRGPGARGADTGFCRWDRPDGAGDRLRA